MSSPRRLHTDTRLSENFTERGLASLTGQYHDKWARYVVKELVDNSLEAAEETTDAPRIEIRVEASDRGQVTRVEVADNGPGIDEDALTQIFEDVSVFSGTKRHYALPTRGNQGNALMTVLGIAYLCGESLIVETQGQRHTLTVTEDPVSGEHRVSRESEPADTDGTRVDVAMPGTHYGRLGTVTSTIGAFVALNPHVEFSVEIDGERTVFEATENPTVERFTLSKRATTGKACWFSFGDFEERLKADARADESLTVDDVVGEFSTLTSSQKRKAVFDNLDGVRNQQLGEYLRESSEPDRRTLYHLMREETRTYSERNLDSTLGSVGQDLIHGLANYLRYVGRYDEVAELAGRLNYYDDSITSFDDLAVYYGDGAVARPDDGEKVVPFYFEVAAVPKADESARTTVEFGINQSVSYSTPHLSIEFSDGNKDRSFYRIEAAFEDLGHPYHVVTNLTCPNIDFQDKGKQQFDTSPFMDVIAAVVGKAYRKNANDIRPALNKLRSASEPDTPSELPNKAPSGFIKEFVFDYFWQAYDEATEGGQYTITMRQLFYVMRPMFQQVAAHHGYEYSSSATREDPDPLELEYGYFANLVGEYEENELGERVVHRDKRGFFVEPHSNRRIDLQTVDVKRYDPDLAKFDTLLFVEKTGFFKLIHQDFKLTEKYDIGLINAKGYSTIAGRNLIEKVQQREDVDLLTLTDLDINGLGIADDAARADDLSAVGEFDAVRLGITVADIEEWNLPVESRTYAESQLTRLKNRVERGELGPEVAGFLTANGGQAVEINALPPAELKAYLVSKFDELGIEKVQPEEEDVETPEIPDVDELRDDAIDTGIGEFVREAAMDDLLDAREWGETLPESEAADRLAGFSVDPEELHADILDKLADLPPKNWEEINKDLVEKIEDEAGEARDEAREEWKEAVKAYLKDHATVEIRLDR